MRFRREAACLVTLLVLLAYLLVAAPAFFRPDNLRDLVLSNVPVLLVAIGMTFVIIAREIDISVGALFGLCSVIAGLTAQLVPMAMVPLVVLMAGALLGAINGSLVAWVRAPSIVVTLAAMVAWREAVRWGTGGAWVQGLPGNFQWFGLGQTSGEVLMIVTSAVMFVLLWWASNNLVALRALYATGSDEESARLAGVPTRWVIFGAFVLIGSMTGLAALFNAVRFSEVPANAGIGLELKAIAAVVVGGTAITGGRGTLLGTLFGVALLGTIGPALIFLGVNPYWEKALQGLIILSAVLLDVLGSWQQRRLTTA